MYKHDFSMVKIITNKVITNVPTQFFFFIVRISKIQTQYHVYKQYKV